MKKILYFQAGFQKNLLTKQSCRSIVVSEVAYEQQDIVVKEVSYELSQIERRY